MNIATKTINILEIIKKLETKKYKLPKFQRDFTWNDQKTAALKRSINKGHPIGAITLYQQGKESLIIDGQQRLTSILKIRKQDNFDENTKYQIPVLIWKSENEEDLPIADFFVDMNDNGSPLDKEDITLTMLSEEFIEQPEWWSKKDTKLVEKMYKNRNDFIAAEESKGTKLSVLEAIWIVLHQVESFNKNHDKNVMAYLSHKDKSEKVKYKLVWMKRIITLIMENDIKKMNFHDNKKDFKDKIKTFLNNILEDEHDLVDFASKLDLTFRSIQDKFDFIGKIPTTASSMKKHIMNTTLAKDYIPIYVLHFIFQNKSLFDSSIRDIKLKNVLETHKIQGVDVVNFMTKQPISAGGFYKWLSYIVEEPEKLFYNDSKEARETLAFNIIEQSNSYGEAFNKLTKVVCMWLASNEIPEKSGNKKEYYQIDHIVPKKYCKSSGITNFSSLANADILNNEDNQDKNSQLTGDYINKSFINKKFKFSSEDVINKINNWSASNNNVNKDEYDNFIAIRKKFISEAIKKQIEFEMTK